RIESWYANSKDSTVIISVFTPKKQIKVEIFEEINQNSNFGKQCCEETFEVSPGYNIFKLHNTPANCVVAFTSQELKTHALVSSKSKNHKPCRIEHLRESTRIYTKTKTGNDDSDFDADFDLDFNLNNNHFPFQIGDEMRFTLYTTVCGKKAQRQIIDNPVADQTYTFDFADITNALPDKIQAYDSVCTKKSVLWQWKPVANADGYKYNTIPEYSSAIDLAKNTKIKYPQKVQNGKNYKIFVWAYNQCGESETKILFAATPAKPITSKELEIAKSGNGNLRILDIFESADSVILRKQSQNVDTHDTIWNYLAEKMCQAAKEIGVGIAAPQVGINRNIVCVQRWDKTLGGEHPWEFYFNPQIVEYSKTVAKRNDGCLSVPDNKCQSIKEYSYRADWIKVAYYDKNGIFHEEKISDQYTAHIFQHEIDHLNAIMYFDRQSEEKATIQNPCIKLKNK
ncbi:MAG: peptide deformylase, partial [Bacteroidales bacterium]|nr:peptide deformylase [Bacteroidales bacterium]